MHAYLRDKGEVYAPIIRARLQDPLGERSIELEFLADTGFRGGVLIPLKTYVELGLSLFEEPGAMGETAVGIRVRLRSSKALVEVNGLKIPCTAYTALNVRRPLLGREVLSKTGLLYQPPKLLKLPTLRSG